LAWGFLHFAGPGVKAELVDWLKLGVVAVSKELEHLMDCPGYREEKLGDALQGYCNRLSLR
jgi:hypothetical protein